MASGQTALSLSDLPFVYSLANILFIWIYGIEDIDRFFVVGLIAGIVGTFLVFWHPIQFLYDRIMMSRYERNLASYPIKNPHHIPEKYDIRIERSLIRLSLKTTSIKYLKDKLVSQDYFMIILITLASVMITDSFQQATKLNDTPFAGYIILGIIGMLCGVVYLSTKQFKEFMFNLKLNSLYFLLTNHIIGFSDASSIIKNAIDLNDWTTAREMIDRQLQTNWDSLKNFSKN